MSFRFIDIHHKADARLVMLKGVICVVFGIVCLIATDEKYLLLTYSLGIAALLNGMLSLFFALYSVRVALRHFWLLHYEGVASVMVGILMLCFPQEAVNIIMGIMAAVLVVMGIVQALLAFDWKRFVMQEWLLLASGGLTILLGIILFKNPYAISSFVTTTLGLFFMITGGYMAYFAYQATVKKPAKQEPVNMHKQKPVRSITSKPPVMPLQQSLE